MSSTAEWLDQCLHNINNSAELPYDADVKWTVRQHLLDLVAVRHQSDFSEHLGSFKSVRALLVGTRCLHLLRHYLELSNNYNTRYII